MVSAARRALLVGAALLAAAVASFAVASPGKASVPIAKCLRHPHRIALNSGWAEEASQAYATLLMWNTGDKACLLRANTGVRFRDRGKRLRVRRVRFDPVHFRRVVPAHGYVFVTWDWVNWCGGQRGRRLVTYRFRLGNVELERHAAPPPCIGRGRASKVGLARIGVVSP